MTIEEKRTRNRNNMRLWRERNKDRVPTPEQRAAHNERNRKYRERHPDRIQRIATESNLKRREQKSEWAKERRKRLTVAERKILNERSRIHQAGWTKNNRGITRQRSHDYYWNNREKVLAASRENKADKATYVRVRRRNSPYVRLVSNLRTRLWQVIKRASTKRAGRTLELVGCSLSTLRDHLEVQFRDGMTWDNYGQWHVDHRTPCASFDLSDPQQQRKCFHFSNLQPLWAQENHIKSKRITAWA